MTMPTDAEIRNKIESLGYATSDALVSCMTQALGSVDAKLADLYGIGLEDVSLGYVMSGLIQGQWDSDIIDELATKYNLIML